MRTRPWLIVILAVFQLLMPFIILVGAGWFYEMTPWNYLNALYLFRTSTDEAMFFAMPALASIAIFSVRRWSYPAFLGAVTWTLYSHTQNWTLSSTIFPWSFLVLTYALNLSLVSYFLLPAVWATYLNPRNHWWRVKPRYTVHQNATLFGPWGEALCFVIDFSEGGAFVTTSRVLLFGDSVKLQIALCGFSLILRAQVTHRTIKDGNAGFGLQFYALTRHQRKSLVALTALLERREVPRHPQKVDLRENFLQWVVRLVRTGRGLVPVVEDNGKKTIPWGPVRPAAPARQEAGKKAA